MAVTKKSTAKSPPAKAATTVKASSTAKAATGKNAPAATTAKGKKK